MEAAVPVGVTFEAFMVDDLPQKGDRAQFLHQAGIEGDFIQPVLNFVGRPGNFRSRKRIDLDNYDVAGLGLIDERENRGVAHVAAIPIGLAIDFNRLEQKRQAGRRHGGVD